MWKIKNKFEVLVIEFKIVIIYLFTNKYRIEYISLGFVL